jgi:hypothetical protein
LTTEPTFLLHWLTKNMLRQVVDKAELLEEPVSSCRCHSLRQKSRNTTSGHCGTACDEVQAGRNSAASELLTTDPPNRCHSPVWHWRAEPFDINDAFRGGNGIGDEYLIADFEGLL